MIRRYDLFCLNGFGKEADKKHPGLRKKNPGLRQENKSGAAQRIYEGYLNRRKQEISCTKVPGASIILGQTSPPGPGVRQGGEMAGIEFFSLYVLVRLFGKNRG